MTNEKYVPTLEDNVIAGHNRIIYDNRCANLLKQIDEDLHNALDSKSVKKLKGVFKTIENAHVLIHELAAQLVDNELAHFSKENSK